jgi:hypothetical protein
MGGERIAAAVAWTLIACEHSAPPPKPAAPVQATTKPGASEPAPTKIGVALAVTPSDAEVSIDGVSYGKVSELGSVVELKPGLYTLTVSRDGYASYRAEFSVEDKTETFVVRLEPLKR